MPYSSIVHEPSKSMNVTTATNDATFSRIAGVHMVRSERHNGESGSGQPCAICNKNMTFYRSVQQSYMVIRWLRNTTCSWLHCVLRLAMALTPIDLDV